MCAIFAHDRGANVTAVSSSPERLDRLRALGAKHTLDRTTDAIPADAYDVVLDPSGGADVATYVAALRPNGRYVLNGIAAGFPAPDFGMALLMNFQRSPLFAAFSLDSIAIATVVSAGERLFERAAAGQLPIVIDQVLPLDQASVAHEALQSNAFFGKIVLSA